MEEIMARQNTRTVTASRTTPLTSTSHPRAQTATGGTGFVSDEKSELFRLGVNGLLGDEKTFHESGKSRDSRLVSLSETIAQTDPTWVAGYYKWLRGPEGNIRTASHLGAAAAIHARNHNTASVKEDELLSSLGFRGVNRHLADSVCQRADEPTELASIYMRQYGKLPKSMKRGLSDAAQRLWNPYSVMKYDTASHQMRFADLMNLGHFSLEDQQLAAHIMNRRYGNTEEFGSLPEMVRENISLRKDVANGDHEALLNPSRLRAAGMTWEDALSLAGPKLDKGKLWSALIIAGMVPIFATIRNLRNFDEAGITNQASEYVHRQLTDEKVIGKSRILPFRFLTALESLDNFKWKGDLETAVQIATRNVPRLKGKTIVLVDTSGSMSAGISANSKMTRAGVAAFFGGAFAAHNADDVALYIYADGVKRVDVKKGHSVLKLAEEMHRRNGEVGHGTQTGLAMRQACYENPDAKRLIDNTDMQSFAHGNRKNALGRYGYRDYDDRYGRFSRYGFSREGTAADVPDKMHLYSFDLAGYKFTNVQTGDGSRTHQLSGMAGDPMYKWMKAIESGTDADWPWENR